jgi:acetyltransferase-like isoleucine patch superfamily enzyme
MSRLRHFLATSDHPAASFVRRARRAVISFTLPAPRAVFVPLLATFIGLRHAYYFCKRVFVCEPFFKTYCTRYGRGVRTGTYIHWVQGKGRILLGDRVLVDGKCSFTFAARYSPEPTLEVGEHTVLSHDCSFAVGRRIAIGKHCLVANGVWMADMNGHPTDPADRLAGLPAPAEKVLPITVGDNVWIGSRCLILPGTTIGEGSVVAAMSVVRGEVPPYTLVAGNPARAVCSLRASPSPSMADGPAEAAPPSPERP